MGTWGVRAFENDTACDWAYGLEGTEDLTHVEAALDQVLAAGEEYLDADVACDALAACEVLARLQGRPGYTSAHTEAVDQWVAARKGRLVPTGEVLRVFRFSAWAAALRHAGQVVDGTTAADDSP
jgi:hypothetical protein